MALKNSVDEIPWNKLEAILAHDPGNRGVAGLAYGEQFLPPQPLNSAVASLASANSVGIVTGFAIPLADGSFASETDGPPGALFLARAMLELGAEAWLITDAIGLPALEAGCDHWGLPRSVLLELPFEPGPQDGPARNSNEPRYNSATDAWCGWFLDSAIGRNLSHLIAIERVGPNHTSASLATLFAPCNQGEPGGVPSDISEFERLVLPEERNLCYNMRGESVNARTAKAHRLFEIVKERRLSIVTLAGADGGNEIGMGRIPWSVLRQKVATGQGEKIACRVPTDHLLTSGVSNWVGYALGLAACVMRGRASTALAWDTSDLSRLLEHLVREAGCVDGVTRLRAPTVDGLSQQQYLQTLQRLREILLDVK